MAFFEKISHNKYRLIVCQGYDCLGKKLRKRKTIKIADNLSLKEKQKELKRQLFLFEEEVLHGNCLDGENISFCNFIETWLKDYAELNLAPATLVSYKQKLSERILPALGHIKLAQLQPKILLEFYKKLHGSTKVKCFYKGSAEFIKYIKQVPINTIRDSVNISYKTVKKIKEGLPVNYKTAKKICESYNLIFCQNFICINDKKLSEKSIRNHMGIISSILSTAVRWNIIKDNPMLRIDMKKVAKNKVQYYDDKQVFNMLEALKNENLLLKTIICLSIDTGIRKSELTGLTWDDVDFETSQISINKQRHYVKGYGIIIGNTKTDAGTRFITVSKTVMRLLQLYKKYQIQQRLKLGSAWQNDPYVFLNDTGKAISVNQPYKLFEKFLEKHNLPRITFHQLRHTNASLLIARGEDIVTVSSRLGHSDKNITLNTYSHIIKSKEIQVADKMDEFFKAFNSYC